MNITNISFQNNSFNSNNIPPHTKENTNNKDSKHILIGALSALAVLGIATIGIYNGKKSSHAGEIRDIILKINERAQNTKNAVEQIAHNKAVNSQTSHSEEYFENIENLWETIDKNWTEWQQQGDKLKNTYGHKAIFEHFNISPKQLSDIHRDIESLHMSLLQYFRTSNSEYETLIPKLAKKILKDGTLDELTKQGNKMTREDICADASQWQKYWRSTFRNVDRPTADINKLKEILQ